MFIRTLLIIILLVLNCRFEQVSAQDSLKIQPKNVFYINAGSFGLWFTASANIERQLFSTDKKFYINYYLRAAGGVFETWGIEGPYGSLSLQAIYGAKNSHLELGIGLGAMYDKANYKISVSNANYPYSGSSPEPTKYSFVDVVPALLIGYRYQRPQGGFVFRTGVGFPDGVYLSVGLAF